MSSLQNKLINYEVTPPPSAWDNIAAALDETTDNTEYPSRLFNMEVAPPAAAWDIISADLPVSNVVPLRKRSNSFYRYAAAALLIGILAFGAVKLMTGKTHSETDTLAGLISSKDTTAIVKTIIASPAETNTNQETSSSPASTVQNDTDLTTQPVKTRQQKNNISSGISTALYTDESVDVDNNPLYAYEDASNLADRYIMLMTPDGKFIRMSKKWGNLVCSVSGDEQDADCKDQLKKWQEKIACSPLAGSSGNFLDVLSLVNSLDDSQGL